MEKRQSSKTKLELEALQRKEGGSQPSPLLAFLSVHSHGSPICSIGCGGGVEDYFNMHPAVSDAAIHFHAACQITHQTKKWSVKVPVSTDYLSVAESIGGSYHSCHSKVYSKGGNECNDHYIQQGGSSIFGASSLLLKEIASKDFVQGRARKSTIVYTVQHYAVRVDANDSPSTSKNFGSRLTVGSACRLQSVNAAYPILSYLRLLSTVRRVTDKSRSINLELETCGALSQNKCGATPGNDAQWDGIFHWSMIRTMLKEYPQVNLRGVDHDVYSTSPTTSRGANVLGLS